MVTTFKISNPEGVRVNKKCFSGILKVEIEKKLKFDEERAAPEIGRYQVLILRAIREFRHFP